MRLLPVLVALLMLPLASAEFGEEVNGYPVGEGGLLHDPAVAFEPGYLERLGQDYPALNKVGPATVYPYYPILTAEVQRLAMDHPDKVRLKTGTSTLGLDIHYLEIANWGDADSGDFIPLEDREVIMIDGGTHSNEYSGVYFVLALAQWLLDGSPEDEFAQWVLENRYTIITPLVNPDGSNAMGRLNVNAVNINRNFPVLWGGDGTDFLLNNPGPSAMSEVETQLVVDRVEHYQPDYHGSIHCCGNLWLFPYGEEGLDPPDVDMMNHICDVAYPPEIRQDCGPIWSTIYPASGSTVDTVYNYTGAVAFGFEMSGRSNLAGPWGEPVTVAEVAEQERESWDGIVHAFENVHLYGGYPVIHSVDVTRANGTQVAVENIGYGILNLTLTGLREDASMGEFGSASASIAPGETQILELPGVQWHFHLITDYQKRMMASPNATWDWQIMLDLDNRTVTHDGESIGMFDIEPVAPSAEVPGLPLFALLGALVVFARRR